MNTLLISSDAGAARSALEQRLKDVQHKTHTLGTSGLSDDKRAEFREAAEGFESMFIHMMLKQMKESMLDQDKGKENMMTFGADTLSGYTDLQFADFAVRQGGMGLADMIYKHLTGGESMPTARQTSNPPQSIQALLKNGPAAAAPALREPGVPLMPSGPAKSNFLDKVIDRIRPYESTINQAAKENGLPTALVKGVIAAESAGKADAVSPVGAKGLMQLMDPTARELGVADSLNPSENIVGGTRYLRRMMDQFQGKLDHALAAYNAGPGNVRKYGGIPPFSETRNYVRKVTRYFEMFGILEKTSLAGRTTQNPI